MYDHDEDAVKIAYYFVWNTEVGDYDVYDVVWLCEDCAAKQGSDLRMADNLSPGDAKRCEDCDRPNEAALSPGTWPTT